MPAKSAPAADPLAAAVAAQIRAWRGATIVAKLGGAAMRDEALFESFAADVALLKSLGANPVVAHGGGPQIDKMLARVNLRPQFADGLRRTDADTLEIVEATLCGGVNKKLARRIAAHGAPAVGICGGDGGLFAARAQNEETLGLVGEIEAVAPAVVLALQNAGFVPVIAPLGIDREGRLLNINADPAAAALAAALGARALFLLTDADGVLDENGRAIPIVDRRRARDLIDRKIARGGILPKVRYALAAREAGVESCLIVNGNKPRALARAVAGQGESTRIEADAQ